MYNALNDFNDFDMNSVLSDNNYDSLRSGNLGLLISKYVPRGECFSFCGSCKNMESIACKN